MQDLTKKGLGAMALVAALVTVPAGLNAQEPVPTQEPEAACTAQLEPAQVQPGESAAQITVSFDDQIGPVTSVEASPESGISLAAPEDLPRTEMAAGEPAPRPISMGDGPNTWNVWLNLSDANAGTHELTFRSSNGECTAEITVGNGG